MKNFKKLMSVVLVLCVLMCSIPVVGFAEENTYLSSGFLVDKENKVVYYATEGTDASGNQAVVKDGVNNVQIEGVNYYDVSGRESTTVDTAYIAQLLKEEVAYQDSSGHKETFSVLSRWADIASAVFEAGGKFTCSHNFDSYYGKGNDDSSSEKCVLSDVLGSATEISEGSSQKDNYHSTGLSTTSSFKLMRQKMTEEISDRINRYTLDPEDILSQGDYCPDALPELNDDTARDIIYNIVTSITREGSTPKYQYNSYGLAFYDFDLMILAGDNFEYKSYPEKTYQNATGSSEKVNISNGRNDTKKDGSLEVSLSETLSESVMTTVENRESYEFGQMIGGEVKFGTDKHPVNVTIKGELTYGQVFESAFQNSETTITESTSVTTVTTVLPAHTITYVEQKSDDKECTVYYDTPVALTFKVCMFSMSGDVYADSVATLAFSTAGYKQSNFTTFFGEKGNAEGSYAYESLQNRIDKYDSVNNWDSTNCINHFYYQKHDGQPAEDLTTKSLDWESIISKYNSSYAVPENSTLTENEKKAYYLEEAAKRVPMLAVGAKTEAVHKGVNSELMAPTPLYLPTAFRVDSNGKDKYVLFTGGVFNMNTVNVCAYDSYDVPYYGFKPTDGSWSVLSGSEDIIEFNENAFIVKALKPGVGYLQWKLNDDVVYTAEEQGQVTSENAPTILVAVIVRDYPATVDQVYSLRSNTASGVKATVGDKAVKLNDLFEIVDENEEVVDEYAVAWEFDIAENPQAVTLNADDTVVFNDDGTYKVRAVINPQSDAQCYTDWVEITPRAEREIVDAKLTVSKFKKAVLLTKYLMNTTHRTSLKYDLSSFVKYYDQYGDEWTGEGLELEFDFADNKGISVDKDGCLVITEPGKYDVTVKSVGLADGIVGNVSMEAEADVQYEIGDSDGNNYLTILDATLIQLYLAQLGGDEIKLDRADVNNDGDVNILDATLIQCHLAGLIDIVKQRLQS